MTGSSTARDRPPEEAGEDTSFARGLRILLTVADRGEVRAEELSLLLDTPTSTVYRYLRTLTAFGFVDRHDGRYLLGPRLVIGSGTNVTSEQLIRIADPVLRYLVGETGETAVITRRIGLSAVCLHQVESEQPLRVSLAPGSMAPLHAGATSRVLLAYALPEILDAVITRGLEKLTPATPDEAVLRAALSETREAGVARSEGELVSGSVGIAAPIFRDQGIVGAVGIIGPAGRCGLAWRARVMHLLPEAARTITAGLVDEAPHPAASIE
jgi:IclR family transcriptional regulator, acetate operon repressor